MAKGRKTGGRDWQPGESGNPDGPAVLPSDLRELSKAGRAELIALITKCFALTHPELKARLEDPATSVHEKHVLKVIDLGIQLGDPKRLEVLWNRAFGKVITPIEHSGELNGGGQITHQVIFDYIQRLKKEEG